ncbi:MAG: hemolysin family protein [Candidatus Hatepunaea meridiana]|nr:hemolysin family protein [Candidatus Hatepunaea meridiana]
MDVDLWIRLTIVLFLLVLSAFFSSVESAYFSLSRTILDQFSESADPRARRVARLLSRPRRLLASILTGNTIVNTAAAAITALVASDIAIRNEMNPNLVIGIQIVLVTIIILIFCELLPKLFALRNPQKWALSSSRSIQLSCLILSPISLPLSSLTVFMSQLFGIEKHSVLAMTEEEIRALVQVGHEHGVLELEERKMIHSIFEFGETCAREVMVPRIDIVTVKKDASFDEITRTVAECGHSRIPVYDDKIDNIIGMIYAKDLLAMSRDPSRFNLTKLLRSTYFIPEEKKIDELLREFQKDKIHIAIVVDEYGGTAGLVTMEDIIEEIVGEIQDEYDTEQPLIRREDERTIIASGRISISDLNEWIKLELIPDNEAYDTLAGFVYSQLGEVPDKGREFEYDDYRFVVEEVEDKRIKHVRIEKVEGVFGDV